MQEDCPLHGLAGEQRCKATEEFFESISTDALKEVTVALSCFALGHEMNFDTLYRAENVCLEEGDAQSCEEL